MSRKSNIDFWKSVLENPTLQFQEMFDEEKHFLLENVTLGNKVIDLGCGTGRNTDTIITKTPYVLGIDSDPLVVREFNDKFRNLPRVRAEQSYVNKLCCEDGIFDVAVSFDLLVNLANEKEEFFIEVSRVLKISGRLLLSTYSETALPHRLEMYELVKAPIGNVGSDGKVLFKTKSGDFVSEQFSLSQLNAFGQQAGLTMISAKKVGDLAYLVVFQK